MPKKVKPPVKPPPPAEPPPPTSGTVISIDPVTRLEGHLKIEVTVDSNKVADARAVGTLFRGLETILANRNPLDAPDITQRICGVCPVSHGMAASLALDAAGTNPIPNNARIMRNLVLGSNFVASHILHFYHLALQDFIEGPDMAPWQPSWDIDKRFNTDQTKALVNNYVLALDMRRKAQEMGSLFGGRLPHPPAFVPGGFTTTPRQQRIDKFKSYIAEVINFIEGPYYDDVTTLAGVYGDYHDIGRGYGNLLAYGVFDEDNRGTKFLNGGTVRNGATTVQPVDVNAITEQVTYSWYDNATNNLKPSAGVTTPQYPKTGAYSWLKAPRYQAVPFETGPLARMWVNTKEPYPSQASGGKISVMDRHKARAFEALKVAYALQQWVGQLNPSGSVYTPYQTPATATAYGLTEAPRGALGHWVRIANGKIANYQIVTPTCWNASPRDGSGARGPIEEALIGTPVQNISQPIEVLRVIHSFDPCLSCAVHVMRPAEGARIYHLGHFHGGEGFAATKPDHALAHA